MIYFILFSNLQIFTHDMSSWMISKKFNRVWNFHLLIIFYDISIIGIRLNFFLLVEKHRPHCFFHILKRIGINKKKNFVRKIYLFLPCKFKVGENDLINVQFKPMQAFSKWTPQIRQLLSWTWNYFALFVICSHIFWHLLTLVTQCQK